MFGFPFNISTTAEASNFPKIRSVPFYIYAMAKASDFKFGTQLGFAQPRQTQKEMWAWPSL